MKEVTGKYNTAKVFTDNLDELSQMQIETLCNQEFVKDSKIRLMPDVHAGAGCTIGTTMTIHNKIVPNLVGVDIGCGMETLVIDKDSEVSRNFSPRILDSIIRSNIPSGFDIRKEPHEFESQVPWDDVKGKYTKSRAILSLGTLGGGNHFIEVDRDDDGNMYIVIHSGSRYAGLEIATYYQEEAWKQLNRNRHVDCQNLINKLKAEKREREINSALKELKAQVITDIPKELAYVEGDLFNDYLQDMRIMQQFAMINRKAMVDIIIKGLNITDYDIVEQFTTIHNYIDLDNMILRKGAVSAQKGEKLLIPINMRDGSLVCEGLGNPDWNCSAPHGAGRILSRHKARKVLTMEEFYAEMSGIWSSSISPDTIDESPMAYKTMNEILSNIGPTAKVLKVIKPIYNFKAQGD